MLASFNGETKTKRSVLMSVSFKGTHCRCLSHSCGWRTQFVTQGLFELERSSGNRSLILCVNHRTQQHKHQQITINTLAMLSVTFAAEPQMQIIRMLVRHGRYFILHTQCRGQCRFIDNKNRIMIFYCLNKQSIVLVYNRATVHFQLICKQ